MRRIGRIVFAVLCGFLVAFVFDCFVFTPIKQHILFPYPFQPIIMALMTAILACFLGGIVAGFISRKHGSILGGISAYVFVLTTALVSNWVFSGFSPDVRNAKIYDAFNVNWEILRYSTALLLGLFGGELGELLSCKTSKSP